MAESFGERYFACHSYIGSNSRTLPSKKSRLEIRNHRTSYHVFVVSTQALLAVYLGFADPALCGHMSSDLMHHKCSCYACLFLGQRTQYVRNDSPRFLLWLILTTVKISDSIEYLEQQSNSQID
jgi:hypothetical protein